MKLGKDFFARDADIVARELLGKVLCRKIDNNVLKAKIVETEAYFDEKDPASRASKGENKVSKMMKQEPGKILVYNVHKYKMLNFVSGKKGVASAVLIRAVEPLNFEAKTSGPGLLTSALKINDEFHGKFQDEKNLLWVEESADNEEFEIVKSFRIGVTKDLPEKLRFYIKGNKFVSRW